MFFPVSPHMLHLSNPMLHLSNPMLHLSNPMLHLSNPMLHLSNSMLHLSNIEDRLATLVKMLKTYRPIQGMEIIYLYYSVHINADGVRIPSIFDNPNFHEIVNRRINLLYGVGSSELPNLVVGAFSG